MPVASVYICVITGSAILMKDPKWPRQKNNNNSNEMFINGAGESCPYIQDM